MEDKEHQLVCCPKCGSTNFMEDQFRQYCKVPAATPGGDLRVAPEGAHAGSGVRMGRADTDGTDAPAGVG
jgi:hypothetical protein